MSPARRSSAEHERACDLAALRVDEPLEPADAAWLDAHLAGCAACAATADAYDADRLLFAPLRAAALTPPRDLWARTAAAIDAEAGRGQPVAGGPRRRFLGLPLASLAPLAGLAVVAVVVGSALLDGRPVLPGPGGPSSPGATAIAMSPDQVAVVTRGADGRLEVVISVFNEVCPVVADSCTAAAPSVERSGSADLGSSSNVDAIISPKRDRVVVVQRDPNGVDGVYVVPVKPAGAAHSPAPSPVTSPASATPAGTATASPEPGETGGDTSGTDSPPTPTESPSNPVATPSGEPATTASATPSGEPTESPSPSPEATATPTTAPTPTPAPTVAVTPAPDGTIEIARDVVVVGGVAAYDTDGSRFAFSARPADGSAGPDVYVWDTADTTARAVTTDHRSIFAGWDGGDLLVSRVVDGAPVTLPINARTGAEKTQRAQAAWLPTVSPDGTHAAWWEGSVRLAADGVSWVPDKGRLVIGAWPDGADDAEVVARGDVAAWEVRWAPDGSAVAAWTSGRSADAEGRLSLYAIDPETGVADLSSALLADEPAFAGFSLEAGRLAYSAPAKDGQRSVWVFRWDGHSMGKVRLPGDAGGTVVR